MNRLCFLLLPSLLTACSSLLHDGSFPTGSQTLVPNASGDALYVVDSDGGNLVRYAPGSGDTSSLSVGLEPTRVARAGDQIFVTLRGSRSVAVVEDRDGTLVTVGGIDVGAEPLGLVAAENGKKVYVAASSADEVQEIDVASLAVTRTWSVGGHPSWLALHPSGNALYVASSMGGDLSWIDLDGDGGVAVLDLPAVYGAGEDGAQRFTRRLTGDLSVSPDGGAFVAPALYLDNNNAVSDPGDVEVQSEGYGSVGLGVSRFNPSLVIVPVDGNGNPAPSDTATVLVAGFAQLDDEEFSSTPVRSYITSAAYSPDGSEIYATMESSETVAVVSATPVYPNQGLSSSSRFDFEFDTGGSISAEEAGFASAPIVLIGTDAGPRSVAFLNDKAFVHSFLDRTVANLHADRASSGIADQLAMGFVSSETYRRAGGKEVMESALAADVEAGRRLFFSATSSQMAAEGAGVSCSTCHFEGRNDGLTWTFEDGVRQTPSLAGAVGATAPFTWTDDVDSVSDEAQITSSGRMGGDGLSYAEAAYVAAYIESVRAVDVPLRGSDDAAVARGKTLFERADVGCVTCHTGDHFTDNESHDMYGLEGVNTPGLVGVAATAPYLHDGSAPTLRAVLQTARGGEMGDTSMLSDSELDDLEAYLSSL